MQQHQHQEVLEIKLLPQTCDWLTDRQPFYSMQDDALCHTAKSVIKFLGYQNIPPLDWSGNSLDMSPVKNIWEIVKHKKKAKQITI